MKVRCGENQDDRHFKQTSRSDSQDVPASIPVGVLNRASRRTAQNTGHRRSGSAVVSKYMVRCRKPPSQTLGAVWRTMPSSWDRGLLHRAHHRSRVLYVFLCWSHDRRRILHFNVTAHPTAQIGPEATSAEHFPCQLPRYSCATAMRSGR